jgi:hypothetical protein
MSVWRRLLGITVRISKEQALEVAKSHCKENALPWVEPVHISLGLAKYEVMTNASHKGGNVTILVDCRTGDVVRSAYAQR